MTDHVKSLFDYEHICVLDLETTGSNKKIHDILEIGMLVFKTEDLLVGPIHEFDAAVKQKYGFLDKMDNYVLKMHVNNGLVANVRVAESDNNMVEDKAIKFLRDHGVKEKKVIMSGSGVGHFDKPFLAEKMSMLEAVFAYPVLDIGVFRRMAHLAGRPDLVYRGENHQLPHRALADCWDHLKELQFYYKQLKEI